MTHTSIMATNLFAMQMVMEAVAHPSVTAIHPWSASVAMWKHVDIISNDTPAATFTIGRRQRRGDITAHCEMEYENHQVVRGIIELIINHQTWEFTGYLENNQMEVQGKLVS